MSVPTTSAPGLTREQRLVLAGFHPHEAVLARVLVMTAWLGALSIAVYLVLRRAVGAHR